VNPATPRRLAFVASAGAAVLVPLAYFPGLDAPFLAPKFSALELAAALAFLAWAWGRGWRTAPAWSPPVAAGAALVLVTTLGAWAVASHGPVGAPYAVAAVARWAALFGLAAGTALLADVPEARQALLEAITAGAAVVSAVGLWQHLELPGLAIPVISAPGSTFGNRNLAAEAVALSLPLSLGAVLGSRSPRGRLFIVAALGLQLVYLAATRARGAWLGAAVGLATVALLARPRLSRAALAGALAVGTVAALVVLVPPRPNRRYGSDPKRFGSAAAVVESSVDARSVALRTRLGLWRRTIDLIGEHRWAGVGPGNWPVFFPSHAEPGAARDGVLSAMLAPRQAHDDLLERAAETGLPGLAAVLMLGAGVTITVRRRLAVAERRAPAAAAAGALVALIGAGLTGFPLEMPATLALGGLALGLLAPVPRSPEGSAPSSAWRARGPLVALAATLVAAAGVRAGARLRASHYLGQAGGALHRDPSPAAAERALAALAGVGPFARDDVRAELTAAQAALRLGRAPEAIRAAERALGREPFSPNAWAALAAARLTGGDPRGARAAAARAQALLADNPLALATEARAARLLGDQQGAAAARAHLAALAAAATPGDRTSAVARQLLIELDAGSPSAPGQ
jgi:O-antigen ligase